MRPLVKTCLVADRDPDRFAYVQEALHHKLAEFDELHTQLLLVWGFFALLCTVSDVSERNRSISITGHVLAWQQSAGTKQERIG